jgi:hypothetical protein
VNYQSLVQDFGVWQGNESSTAQGTGNTTGAVFGPFVISDPAANNNPNFGIRIVGSFNAANVEQYLLDSFVIRGAAITAIPAPAALPAGLVLLTLVAGRRRRA